MRRGLACVVLVLLLGITATGCWDRAEVNDLAIVGAMGVDLDEQGLAMLSLEVLNPGALARGTQTTGAARPDIIGWIIEEPLSTIGEALANIARRTPRFIYLGQVNMVVFGQEAAKVGVGPWLDYIKRNHILRRSMFITVCDTAVGLMERPLMEDMASLTLEGLVRTTSQHSMTRLTTLNDFLRQLNEPGIEPITMHTVGRPTHDLYITREGLKPSQLVGKEDELPRPDVHDPRAVPPKPEEPRDVIEGSALPQTEQTVFVGLSVFHGDRLVGFLDGLEARGYMWLTGGISTTWLGVPHPTSETGTCVMQLIKHSPKIRAEIRDGRPYILCSVDTKVQLAESTEPIDLLDRQTREHLVRATARAIEQEARATLARVQGEYRSDVYGFGAEVHRVYPKYWSQVEDRWDEIFPDVPVQIEVRVLFRGGGTQISSNRGP